MLSYSELQSAQRRYIEELRLKAKGWLIANDATQRQLASVCRISETFLSDFPSGRKGLSNGSYMRLSAVFDAPTELIKLQIPNRGAKIVNVQSNGRALEGERHIEGASETVLSNPSRKASLFHVPGSARQARYMQLNKR
jgi:transcriptional regulator with XRE-family HTH domain